jgi:hypothetical protein
LVDVLRGPASVQRPGIVVLSGLGDPATQARAADLGCAFLAKPYLWNELDEEIIRSVELVDDAPTPSGSAVLASTSIR